MGRKKKENIEENKINTIKYTGEVKVQVKHKNKVLSTKTFKNAGRWPLFKYLAACLCGLGEDPAYASSRPQYIGLFSGGAKGDIKPTINDDKPFPGKKDDGNNVETRLSSKLMYSTQPKFTLDTTPESGSAEAMFKFMIPGTSIKQTDAEGGDVNVIALYSPAAGNSDSSAAAYFIVTDEENPNLLDTLVNNYREAEINVNDINVYIQWTLKLSN